MDEQVTAVKKLEQQQVELIKDFSERAKSQSAAELAELVHVATSNSALITFSMFLSLPTFTQLSGTLHASSLDLLRLFAYGTWNDYTKNHYTFPKLVPEQIQKLKQLTLMILAQATKVLTYDQLKKELDFSNLTDLEFFLNRCTNLGIIAGKLNQQLQQFEVLYTVDASMKFYGEEVAGQSFDTFLQEATIATKDEKTGLWSNAIVRQVELPTDSSERCYKSEFETKGSRLFSMLLQHATSAHIAEKSFGGHIYTGMFTVIGDQLFLRQSAVARKSLTDDNFLKDQNAVAVILKRYTGLDVSHKNRDGTIKKILYPLYMSDLLDHLEGRIANLHPLHLSRPISKARDVNYIIFLVCHATFLTPAEHSLIFWYVRTYHKGSSSPDQANFKTAMGRILHKIKWYAELKNHWLFEKVFQSGLVTYMDNEVDCFRLIRDWEMHIPKHLTELQKIKYTAAVLNYLVEHHFGDFLPQAMYQMLCTYSMMDNKFDLRDWIERLHKVSKDDIILLTMEWDRLSLQGLLPGSISSSENQISIFMRDMEKLLQNEEDTETSDCSLAKWRILNRLHEKNETMYYKVLIENIEEYAPIVYRPTVGLVCQVSSGTFRKPWAMYFSAEDQGKMISMVNNFPADEIDIIVVTDGSNPLALGDLGVKGIGVAAGKIDLYVAAAGINPRRILPVMVDVGTNSTELLKDSLYYGIQDHRLDGETYLTVLDEFMLAVFTRWPRVIVEFEGFESKWAYSLLERYRQTYRIFNDDIQGTAAVTIAGLLGVMRAQGRPISDLQKQRIVIANFGRVGVLNSASWLLAEMLGISEDFLIENETGRSQTWIVDAHGLITEKRTDVDSGVRLFSRKSSELFSHELNEDSSLIEVIKEVKPDALIGLSADGSGDGRFSNQVLEALKYSSSSRPAIFAMSNPPECTARDAFSVLGENITFASGSTFSDVDLGNGKLGHSFNGNTIYLFPGIILGTLLSGARLISARMFQAAVTCFALNIKEEEVLQGIIYPPISRIREITKLVAAAVVAEAILEGQAEGYRLRNASELTKLTTKEIADHVELNMWSPE